MSNNAVSAYENGEKPLSKWKKADILKEIEKQEVDLKCSMVKLKKLPVGTLKAICLRVSSWHHTSNHYNKTDFYSLDIAYIEEALTEERVDKLLLQAKQPQKAEDEPQEEKWKCAFLEWSGTRAHPKATEIIEIGIVKGNWFYRADGSKKKTTANGFEFLEKIE